MSESVIKTCYPCSVNFQQEENEAEGQKKGDCRRGWLDTTGLLSDEYWYHIIYAAPRTFQAGPETQVQYFSGWHRLAAIEVDFTAPMSITFNHQQLGASFLPDNRFSQRPRNDIGGTVRSYDLFIRDVQNNIPSKFSFAASATLWKNLKPKQRENYKALATEINHIIKSEDLFA